MDNVQLLKHALTSLRTFLVRTIQGKSHAADTRFCDLNCTRSGLSRKDLAEHLIKKYLTTARIQYIYMEHKEFTSEKM